LHFKLKNVNDKTLQQITAELKSVLIGQKFGKIFSLSRFQAAIDFRLSDSRYLFVSIEPTAPRVYLITRRLRDLEKSSKNSHPFFLLLRKKLSNAVLRQINKIENERILRLDFSAQNEIGEAEDYALIIQLTGRSANIFLLDENDFVLDAVRENIGEGQEIGGRYAPPSRAINTRENADEEIFPQKNFQTLSESLDNFYLEKEIERIFQTKAQATRNKLKQELNKREKLVKNLRQDLENHGDAAKWKRFGDLILANLATAARVDNTVLVTDFFEETTPVVEIEVDENLPLTEAAEKFFKRYTKARNAGQEISKRLAILEAEIEDLKRQGELIEEAIEEKDIETLDDFAGEKPKESYSKPKKTQAESFNGARHYNSSDGFEILVGKGAKDNDFLTFRVAKSNDLWLHAADYPGSHVVVKNPNRREIPPKTILEAAQAAAFFSHAREQPKVAVHYTTKKFVNKPKGASLGLVSLSSFKTILVEPRINF
jgi:predicted ribosome quality control (RQC) complex YloA/Tae2 family protein